MERLFTEPQWRAIAEVERLTIFRADYDGFHFWCGRKRLLGPTFAGGEFYLGERMNAGDQPEFRVIERTSGLDFSKATAKDVALSYARERIQCIADYLPELLAWWTEENAHLVADWERMRAEAEARVAIAKAKAEAKAAKQQKVGRRRMAIFRKSEGKCHYCETQLELRGSWHVEHRMPKTLGGSDEPVNLVAACAPCNLQKNDKTDVEFLAELERRKTARA